MRLSIVSSLLLAALVSAAPVELETRQSATTCGSTRYTSSQVNNAFQQGFNDYEDGNTPGGYPHTYNNYEGFDFPVDGPYQEFPILKSGTYKGGSPGADRVIFNTDGEYAGAITHTGASGNNFVGCSGTS